MTDVVVTVSDRPSRILILSSNPAQLDMISRQAPEEHFECVPSSDIQTALSMLHQEPFDVFVVDEDLRGVSGVDVLIQARELEPYTSFVLVAHEELGVGVAADALNQADVSRILLAPFELEEWIDCCVDAGQRYEQSLKTQRNLNLSQAKVRRLNLSVEQTKKDLKRKARQLEQLRQAPVAPRAMGPTPEEKAQEERKLYTKISTILSRVILSGPNGEEVTRQRKLVEYCGRKLKWPASEVRQISQATLYHHCLLGEYPEESKSDLRGGKAKHAAVTDELLSGLPGFSEIARIIGEHHGRRSAFDSPAKEQEITRGARLLQIVSLFDEMVHDPKTLSSEQSENDPDFALNRASETILRLAAEEKLDQELAERCIKDLIPRSMERDETCLDPEDLQPGMQLSRTIYADNLMLIRGLEELTATNLEQIRYAHETQKFPGVWVIGRIKLSKKAA